MSFNGDDADALSKARERFFPASVVRIDDDQHQVMRIEVGPVVAIDAPSQTLADALTRPRSGWTW